MKFEINIILKKDITQAITIPILHGDKDTCQMRHDGFLVNSELFLWETIEKVIITPYWYEENKEEANDKY